MLTGQIINGLVSGAMYALVAIGFTLVIGVLDKLNFAHPETMMLGGFVGVVSMASLPIWWAFLAALVVGGAMGLLTEFIAFRRFKGGGDAKITAALASMALGLIVTDLVHKIWGTEAVNMPPYGGWAAGRFAVAGVEFQNIQIVIVALTIVLAGGLHVILQTTRAGRRIRAVAEAPVSASLLGIDVLRTSQSVFFISSALAAEAGLLLALRSGAASSEIGLTFGLKALAIMAIGGMGDLRGAAVAGLVIGILEALMFYFGLGKLSELTVWAAMIVTLMFRPSGIFGGGAHAGEQRA